MNTHEAFVELYGLLERTYVGRFPLDGEHCLMTGVAASYPYEEEDTTGEEMRDLLSEVTGVERGSLYKWSDAGPKEKVLAAVATCIARTAPLPPVPEVEAEEMVVA